MKLFVNCVLRLYFAELAVLVPTLPHCAVVDYRLLYMHLNQKSIEDTTTLLCGSPISQ